MKSHSLGELISPLTYNSPLNVEGYDLQFLEASLQKMVLIRCVERQLAEGRRSGLIGGPVHLGVGQEAVAVGVSAYLNKRDRVFGAHRSHSHLLALGSDVKKLFSEVLGRDSGHSRGMGGSMHLWDQSVGFYGSVPIVAGTVPLAVGAAMAARLQKTNDIAVAYFGDGACEEGVVHEAFNLASIQKDPILFVVENNLFASHMHISIRQSSDATARFAEANRIPYHIVDGNNVLAVSAAAKDLISAARNGNGPGFLEAVTYRWYGHVDWRDDIDVGVNRSQHDIENWRAKDPIKRLVEGMIASNLYSLEKFKAIEEVVQRNISELWAASLNEPYPESKSLLMRVYAEVDC